MTSGLDVSHLLSHVAAHLAAFAAEFCPLRIAEHQRYQQLKSDSEGHKYRGTENLWIQTMTGTVST